MSKIFFTQDRVGKDGKWFKIYKFRTMRLGSEEDQEKYRRLNEADGPVFKVRNDPRFTRIGKWLARVGLDELPQILNIINGEMGIVGPRPLIPKEEMKIPEKWRFKRRSVKPGLTSSWFVRGAHMLSFTEWMELDMEDIQRKNFWYDFGIILMTSVVLVVNAIKLILAQLYFGDYAAMAGISKRKRKNDNGNRQIYQS